MSVKFNVVVFPKENEFLPDVAIIKVSVDQVGLKLRGESCFKSVCTSTCRRVVASLESKQMQEAIEIIRSMRIEWCQKCGYMLLRHSNSDLPIVAHSKHKW